MFIREYNRETERINLRCDKCGEIVAEYVCNESGIPCVVVFDDREDHICLVEGDNNNEE